MAINKFKTEILRQLSDFEFIEDIKIVQNDTTIRIRIYLKNKILLSIFYNKYLKIQSFALIKNENRIWGFDKDNRFGWHEHTIENPNSHEKVNPHTISQIIDKCKKTCLNLKLFTT